MKTIPIIWLVSIMMLTCSCGTQSEDEIWAQFRGNNGSGIAAADEDPPVIFGPDQNLDWSVPLPTGHSSPCIWGDKIFITGFDEENTQLKMFCINRKKGTIIWEKDISTEELEEANPLNSPASATPATDGERVYFYFSSYGLLCYDFNGDLQWETPMPPGQSRHGMATSPMVTGDVVILNLLGLWNDPHLIAINKLDGTTAWKYELPFEGNYRGSSYSTPVVYNDQVIINSSLEIVGFDINTGKRIWGFPISTGDAVCTPVMSENIIYTVSNSTSGDSEMLDQFPEFQDLLTDYDKNGDLKIDQEEGREFPFYIYPGMPDILDGQYAWTLGGAFGLFDYDRDGFMDSTEYGRRFETSLAAFAKQGLRAILLDGNQDQNFDNLLWYSLDMIPVVSSPVLYDNKIYMIRAGGMLSCIDAENGEVIYRNRIGAPGAYFSSPVVANGRIYVASRIGVVTVIETGDTPNILAQNDLDEMITATPAVVDNRLYIRTAESLYAFR